MIGNELYRLYIFLLKEGGYVSKCTTCSRIDLPDYTFIEITLPSYFVAKYVFDKSWVLLDGQESK